MNKLTYSKRWDTFNGKVELDNGVIAYGYYSPDGRFYLVEESEDGRAVVTSSENVYSMGAFFEGFAYVVAKLRGIRYNKACDYLEYVLKI